MLIDSTGLGYTAHNVEIFVHYPSRHASDVEQSSGDTGANSRYGVGWPIGPIPVSYAYDAPNAITAERVQLWNALRNAFE